MQIRELKTLEEFQRCVEIQKEVWGFDDPFDVVPLPLLIVSERNDGIVLGAFLEEGEAPEIEASMIGFVYSLPGFHEGRKVQWSHMLAVIPPYRNSNVGYALKMEQYRRAQEMGYDMVEWTYDPLESRNAHFNLKKLGCIAREYEVNIYGETSSPLHMGTPTDRLIAHWPIPSLSKSLPEQTDPPQPPALITTTREEQPGVLLLQEIDLKSTQQFLYLEIPGQMQTLKAKNSQAALDWRLKTRELFLHYLSNGYVVYSFLYWTSTEPNKSFYILTRL